MKGGIGMDSSKSAQYGHVINWLYHHGYGYHGGIDKFRRNGKEASRGVWVATDAAHTLEAYLKYVSRHAPDMIHHTYSI